MKINKQGYIEINGELEHRKIVEAFIGRKLTAEEKVHHINFNKLDNRISNLMIFPNQKAHISFHKKFKKFGLIHSIRNQIAFRWKDYKNSPAISEDLANIDKTISSGDAIFDYEKHTGFTKPIWELNEVKTQDGTT